MNSKSKCPYFNCKLKCNSEAHHRAIYSSIQEKKHKSNLSTKSRNINYEKLEELEELLKSVTK